MESREFCAERVATRSGLAVDELCDYEQKYAPDEEHKEMSPNARVWKVYLDECRKFDTRRFEEWRDGLDVFVVFAFQRLRPDHHSMTSALLAEMVEIERAIADGTPVEEIAHTITDFTPKTSDLWVNGLCFSSQAAFPQLAEDGGDDSG
ncbi:hypothetical protein BDZ89DRAFT_1138474 [Hymenopellis radicata]|nr:hypothetical protein BDZ89DRAFT_1138474 [Hymenopellis radicata]